MATIHLIRSVGPWKRFFAYPFLNVRVVYPLAHFKGNIQSMVCHCLLNGSVYITNPHKWSASKPIVSTQVCRDYKPRSLFLRHSATSQIYAVGNRIPSTGNWTWITQSVSLCYLSCTHVRTQPLITGSEWQIYSPTNSVSVKSGLYAQEISRRYIVTMIHFCLVLSLIIC